MSAKKVLVNYRIAESVKAEFERLCRAMQVSMTTQINLMMREFIAKQKAEGEQ